MIRTAWCIGAAPFRTVPHRVGSAGPNPLCRSIRPQGCTLRRDNASCNAVSTLSLWAVSKYRDSGRYNQYLRNISDNSSYLCFTARFYQASMSRPMSSSAPIKNGLVTGAASPLVWQVDTIEGLEQLLRRELLLLIHLQKVEESTTGGVLGFKHFQKESTEQATDASFLEKEKYDTSSPVVTCNRGFVELVAPMNIAFRISIQSRLATGVRLLLGEPFYARSEKVFLQRLAQFPWSEFIPFAEQMGMPKIKVHAISSRLTDERLLRDSILQVLRAHQLQHVRNKPRTHIPERSFPMEGEKPIPPIMLRMRRDKCQVFLSATRPLSRRCWTDHKSTGERPLGPLFAASALVSPMLGHLSRTQPTDTLTVWDPFCAGNAGLLLELLSLVFGLPPGSPQFHHYFLDFPCTVKSRWRSVIDNIELTPHPNADSLRLLGTCEDSALIDASNLNLETFVSRMPRRPNDSVEEMTAKVMRLIKLVPAIATEVVRGLRGEVVIFTRFPSLGRNKNPDLPSAAGSPSFQQRRYQHFQLGKEFGRLLRRLRKDQDHHNGPKIADDVDENKVDSDPPPPKGYRHILRDVLVLTSAEATLRRSTGLEWRRVIRFRSDGRGVEDLLRWTGRSVEPHFGGAATSRRSKQRRNRRGRHAIDQQGTKVQHAPKAEGHGNIPNFQTNQGT
eukprot:GHVT01049326.1.p1 GENE.GHVT01049326.1~~GHVT01049326.1.p1  ORF type:complete len:673 (+),score=32.46 GHVT01049326.1:2717-4735(+)